MGAEGICPRNPGPRRHRERTCRHLIGDHQACIEALTVMEERSEGEVALRSFRPGRRTEPRTVTSLVRRCLSARIAGGLWTRCLEEILRQVDDDPLCGKVEGRNEGLGERQQRRGAARRRA